MLLPYLPTLANRKIVLASASPRRKELLASLGLKFDVEVSTFDETLPKDSFKGGAEYAVATARHKALEVAFSGGKGADLVVGADTVVEHDGVILEKPDDDNHARQMLSTLSGGVHKVHTGVVLVLQKVIDPATGRPPLVKSFFTTTEVEFDVLSPALIDAYIASGEPFGKAGSYGIQGLAGSFVTRIHGCYFNVVGLPVHDLTKQLADLVESGALAAES